MIRTSFFDHLCYCASNLAYLVDGKGCFPPNSNPQHFAHNPYLQFAKKHGLQHVQPFANEQSTFWDRINAAIVMEFPSYNILAFRGTLPPACHIPAIEDWIQDFCVTPKEVPGVPGLVHSGIYDGYATIKDNIFNYLSSIPKKPLWVTGHSKGGPMTSYGVWDALEKGYRLQHVVTFASPRPGSAIFADEYNNRLRSQYLTQIRYENDLDIVPLLPPGEETAAEFAFVLGLLAALFEEDQHPDLAAFFASLAALFVSDAFADYTHVGALNFITKDHHIINDISLSTRFHQITQLFKTEWPWQAFGTIADAHLIAIGGGYQKGVFPDIPQS